MQTQIQLGNLAVDVVRKDIKNVHLSVHPPAGRVRIAAPQRMSVETIRVFAIAKLAWIKQQQHKLQEQQRETPREYVNRESHYLWGRRCLLTVSEVDEPPSLEMKHNRLLLHVRPGTDEKDREKIVSDWYRVQLKDKVPPLINKWERILGVKVKQFFVQKMKTRWGSCNRANRSIRLNSDLAKKPHACLEYIVVHEMIHLLEGKHNLRFIALMNRFMPKWQFYREELNRLPVRHENWCY
jgi:predicted metal-dependent hydrolase